ncbi:MAG: hypothetical protein CMP23_06095 [Rickettsiales bacterium]|nr:hypothetical protein [Rickettsiales bacterium]
MPSLSHRIPSLVLVGAAAAFTSGCDLSLDLEAYPGSIDISGAQLEEEEPSLAALARSAAGDLEIILFEEDGTVEEVISTSYSLADAEGVEHSLMRHSDGFFLVTSRTDDWMPLIVRVEDDGLVSEFARPQVNPMYRIDEAPDGGVIVAAEYDLVKLDLNGVEVARDHNNLACWTDVVGAPLVFDGAVAVDVMGATSEGPVMAEWIIDEASPFSDSSEGVATFSVGENPNRDEIIGQDDSGALWTSGRSGILQRSVAGSRTELGTAEELFGSYGVRALEGRSENSVYVLMDAGIGSQVAELSADGDTEVLFEYGERLLQDLVVMP